MNAFGGFFVTDGNSVLNVPAAGVVLSKGKLPELEVVGAGKEGEQSAVESPSSGQIKCVPGKYLVTGHVSIEGEYFSANSGDAVGVIESQVRVAGQIVPGSKAKSDLEAEGQIVSLPFNAVVEVTAAQLDAGTNYIEFALASNEPSGNDVIVREASLNVVRLD